MALKNWELHFELIFGEKLFHLIWILLISRGRERTETSFKFFWKGTFSFKPRFDDFGQMALKDLEFYIKLPGLKHFHVNRFLIILAKWP